MIHPWELVVKQREIEHIHYPAEHEWKRSSRHGDLRPYKSVEKAVYDVSHGSRRNHGEPDQNPGRSTLLLCQSAYPPAQRPEKDYPENGQQGLAPESSEGHAESHSFIEDIMELEPVTQDINGLAKTHIGLDEHFDYLVDDD